ncbi:MAG: thiamine pyrophosphate-binding protein [Pseudomonadota bacterium]
MATGAALFVDCLKACGIDTVFALPGEETNALMDALARVDIDVVLCRHEQAAAFMASVHGRVTGRPAACLSTLGPGATNLLTGVADAQLDAVPLLAITGQGARKRLPRGQHSHQVIDLARLFEPVTKRSETIMAASDIPGAVAEAMRVAMDPCPGAVHLSLPEDVADEDTDADPVAVLPPARPLPSPRAVSAAVTELSAHERIMFLSGAGVTRTGTAPALAALVASTGLPVATSFMGKGCVSHDASSHLGAFGLPVDQLVDKAIADADVIVTVGLDPVEYPLEKLSGGTRPVVALAETSLPQNLGAPLAAEVVGDLRASLEALTHALKGRRFEMWPSAQAAQRAYVEHREQDVNAEPPTAPALVAALNAVVAPEDTVLSGVGTHKLALARDFVAHRPGQIVIANGLAGMGLALPGAIAAARLQSSGRVIAVCGDGDVMMNVQEMETAHRLDLPMTVIVWVDGGYGLIEDKQEHDTGTRPNLSFGTVDWAALAQSFGWSHTACDTAAALQDAVQARPGDARQRLITVPVRYTGAFA